MAVCKYFQRGSCKFGNNCRYEHTTGGRPTTYSGNSGNFYNNQYSYSPSNQYVGATPDSTNSENRNAKPAALNATNLTFNDFLLSVCEEIQAGELGKQWPLSCFGPRKESDNYPGLDDVSPEELRHEAYQCQLNGTSDTYVWNVERMYKIQREVCQSIKSHSPEAVQILTKLFQETKIPDTFGAINQPLFGQSVSSSTGDVTSASNFSFSLGNKETPTAAPLYGQSVNSAWPAAAQPPQQQSASTFVFATSTSAPPAFGSVVAPTFGGTTTTPTVNAFQQPVQQQQSVFATTAFSQPQNAFFQQPTESGTTPNQFQESNNLWLNNNNNNKPSSIFGGNTTSSLFGSGSAGATNTTTTTTTSSATNPDATSGPVTATRTTPSGARDTGDLYTPLDELNADERAQFEGQQFSAGNIPLRPPPREFCI